jgi:hypothetical protein
MRSEPAMTRPRITIAGLMAIVLYVAVGFAALRNADAFWASATLSLAILSVSVALAGALACRGRARASWAGFAAASLACLVIWLSAHETVGFVSGPPRLLAFWGFRLLGPYINPAAGAGGQPYIYYVQVSNSLESIVFGLAGAFLARFIPVKDER